MISLIKDEKGSAIIEMAGFILTCAMIVFGFIAVTGIVRDNLGMHAAAREAARDLSVWQNTAEAEMVAINELAAAGVENYHDISATISGGNATVLISKVFHVPMLPQGVINTKAEYSFFLEVRPEFYETRGYYDRDSRQRNLKR